MSNMENAVEELLSHFPPENIADPNGLDNEVLAAHSGCQTCAEGDACQERIRTDIDDILSEAGLDHTEMLTCLQWLMQEEYSSLNQSVTEMARDFQEHLAINTSNTEHSFKGCQEARRHDNVNVLER